MKLIILCSGILFCLGTTSFAQNENSGVEWLYDDCFMVFPGFFEKDAAIPLDVDRAQLLDFLQKGGVIFTDSLPNDHFSAPRELRIFVRNNEMESSGVQIERIEWLHEFLDRIVGPHFRFEYQIERKESEETRWLNEQSNRAESMVVGFTMCIS